MDIEAVVFDLGNVLVDVMHERAATALEACCDGGTRRLHETITSSPLLHRLESGTLDAAQFFIELSEHARLAVGLEELCAAFCDIFVPVPEMIDAHAALRSAGLRTYIFSNTSALHFDHLARQHDFLSRFDGHFLSYKLGSMKPHALIYDAVERGTQLQGRQLLYLDDRLENVEVGAQRGWQVIHHVSAAQTIARLRELRLL